MQCREPLSTGTTRLDEALAFERAVSATRNVQAASAALQGQFAWDGDDQPSPLELVSSSVSPEVRQSAGTRVPNCARFVNRAYDADTDEPNHCRRFINLRRSITSRGLRSSCIAAASARGRWLRASVGTKVLFQRSRRCPLPVRRQRCAQAQRPPARP
jgi:hypothetical protein